MSMETIKLDPIDTSLESAVRIAARDADETMIPQTVFLSFDVGGGWMNRPILSPSLSRADHTYATMIPAGYFDNWSTS